MSHPLKTPQIVNITKALDDMLNTILILNRIGLIISLVFMSRFEVQPSGSSSEPLSPLAYPSAFQSRVKFSPRDDEALRDLVESLGTSDWPAIVAHMPGKNVRQCKERWINYLAPVLNTAPWTAEEDYRLIQKYAELGPRWVQIAAFFSNRTDSMIKNRFNKLQRREQKRRELVLRGEFAFALPLLQSMMRAAPAPLAPIPRVETAEFRTAVEHEVCDFNTGFCDDSFGFADEMFDA
jgi:hypothetical protein